MDDILSVTPLGTEELPKHINQQFKDGATFYRSKTKFGVVADGTVRVYPCDLLVLQTKSGDRYIYDFVNVGTPTLAAKDALDSETLAQVNARMPTVGSGPAANSVSNSSTAGNNQTQTPRITNAPARLGCAEPPWTFAIGFARRDPAAPPVQGMTSHPTGDRRDAIGRIHRPPDRPLRFKASGTPARRTCEAIRRVRVQFPWRAIAEGRPGPICAGSCCGSSASFAGEGGMCC